VQRTVYAEVPVKVEYCLTADGQRLRKVVEVLKEFGLWLKQEQQQNPEQAKLAP
jgi:DNA-binding HxlR family transcriptional regulator